MEMEKTTIPVNEITINTAKKWPKENQLLLTRKHMNYQVELSTALRSYEHLQTQRMLLGANDTSAAVGYAPLTRTENWS
jgi:S-adenosylmethionine synthetase